MIRCRTLLAPWLVGLALLATAGVAQEGSPKLAVDTILGAPEAPAAAAAVTRLAASPESVVALEAIRTAWGERAPSGMAAALLAGAGLAQGDQAFERQAKEILRSASPEERRGLLSPLAFSKQKSTLIEALLPDLLADPDPGVQAAAAAVQARYDELGRSGGIWLFLVLLVLAVVGGGAYLVRSAADVESDSDTLRAWIDAWTDKPRERARLLQEVRAIEDPVPRLLAMFAPEVKLNVTQVMALLDLLSHFDVDPVHEKLYQCAEHSDDQVKKAAILAMHRLADPAWVDVLVAHVRGDDDVARFAGATALALRGAVDQLPMLREEIQRTRLGSVQDGMREAIEKLEAKQAEAGQG